MKILVSNTYPAQLDTYFVVGTFIVNNYRQALSIISDERPVQLLMSELGVNDGSTFEDWLEEEKAYLHSLIRELPEETLQMDYVSKLLDLEKIE